MKINDERKYYGHQNRPDSSLLVACGCTLEFLIDVLDGIRVLEGQKGKI